MTSHASSGACSPSRSGTSATSTASPAPSASRAPTPWSLDLAFLARRRRCEPGGDSATVGQEREVKVWIDITAPAHVLVFRPLLRLLHERGAEVEVTSRDYAQTVQLLELHGIEAEVLGRHGGRSRLGKARSLTSRLHNLRRWARGRGFDVALAHGSHELTLTARRLGIPSATTFDYEFAW